MMSFPDRKKIATMIVAHEPYEKEIPEGNESDDLGFHMASKAMIDAIHSKSPKTFHDALKSWVDMYESKPHMENEGENEWIDEANERNPDSDRYYQK